MRPLGARSWARKRRRGCAPTGSASSHARISRGLRAWASTRCASRSGTGSSARRIRITASTAQTRILSSKAASTCWIARLTGPRSLAFASHSTSTRLPAARTALTTAASRMSANGTRARNTWRIRSRCSDGSLSAIVSHLPFTAFNCSTNRDGTCPRRCSRRTTCAPITRFVRTARRNAWRSSSTTASARTASTWASCSRRSTRT